MNKSNKLVTKQGNYLTYLLFLFAVMLVMFSVSSHSLWIDEGISVYFASLPSFGDMLHEVMNTNLAESLMPGYVIYMWIWAKVFGLSEYSLRLSNAPFIIVVLFLFTKLPLKQPAKGVAILLTSLSPLLWFYMNEVRSYIILFSFSTIGLLGVLFYFRGGLRWRTIGPYLTVISLLLGTFFNVSCGFTVPALVLTGFLLHNETNGHKLKLIHDWTKPVLLSIPFFLVLGCYCLWVISGGSGGRLQQHYVPGFGHVVFTFYEFFGFMGLGPPRNILRANPLLATFIPYLPWLIPAVLLVVAFALYVIFFPRKASHNRGWIFENAYLWGLLFGFLFFYAFAFITKFVFYGRHIIFLYPYLILAIAFAISKRWHISRSSNVVALLVAGLLLMCLTSDIRLRFYPEYSKDDYRLAVKTAISMSKHNVPIYWAANPHTGAYYGLYYYDIDSLAMNIHTSRRIQKAHLGVNWSTEKVKCETDALESAILVLSKPDLFDKKKAWHFLIKAHKPTEMIELNAFRIYRFDFYRG